ncbi:hypothetical protein FKM82_025946 [Ascaphus truei]
MESGKGPISRSGDGSQRGRDFVPPRRCGAYPAGGMGLAMRTVAGTQSCRRDSHWPVRISTSPAATSSRGGPECLRWPPPLFGATRRALVLRMAAPSRSTL